MSQTVEVTRYPNRRLYDRSQRQYVTLGDVEQMVRNGKQVRVRDSKTQELKGEAAIDQGLLVLAAEDSQMVGAATFSDDDKKMNFVIAGGPSGDPGLDFVKKT